MLFTKILLMLTNLISANSWVGGGEGWGSCPTCRHVPHCPGAADGGRGPTRGPEGTAQRKLEEHLQPQQLQPQLPRDQATKLSIFFCLNWGSYDQPKETKKSQFGKRFWLTLCYNIYLFITNKFLKLVLGTIWVI